VRCGAVQGRALNRRKKTPNRKTGKTEAVEATSSPEMFVSVVAAVETNETNTTILAFLVDYRLQPPCYIVQRLQLPSLDVRTV